MSDSGTSSDTLRAKYTFGSLYLTYIPLNDMTHLLGEDEKFAVLASRPPFRETLQVFKAFLDETRGQDMNDAVAFVQLDLNTNKAGVKRMSDRDGEISPIPWSESQVLGIAGFCDAFLNSLLVFEKKHSSIVAGKVTLARAWKDIESLKKNPYIAAVRSATLDRPFTSLRGRRPGELRDLKSENKEIYAAIRRFTAVERTGDEGFIKISNPSRTGKLVEDAGWLTGERCRHADIVLPGLRNIVLPGLRKGKETLGHGQSGRGPLGRKAHGRFGGGS